MSPIIQCILKNTVVYGFIIIMGRFINYLLIPFYTLYIPSEDYGIISEIYSIIAILNLLFTYGMETTYFRYGDGITKKLQTLLFSSNIVLSVIVYLTIFLITHLSPYVQYIVAIVFIDNLLTIPFDYLRQQSKLLKYAILKLLQIFVNVALNILYIRVLHWEPIKFILIANIVSSALALPFLNVFNFEKFTTKELGTWLSFGLPLMFNNIMNTLNDMWCRVSLRYFLPNNFYNNISNDSIIGIIGVNYKLAMLIPICNQAFRYAIDPLIFKLNKNIRQNAYQQIMHYYIILGGFMVLAISINRRFLGTIFLHNNIYKFGVNIIPYVALYHFCMGIFYNMSIEYKMYNKTKQLSLFSLISLVINISLSLLLVKHYGYMGYMVSSNIGVIVMLIFTYIKNPIQHKLVDLWWLVVDMLILLGHEIFIKNYVYSMISTLIYMVLILLFLYKNIYDR